MTELLLDIQDLCVNFSIYDGTLKVLNNVKIKVRNGEKVGLIGEAGCGKTTTVKSIVRILPVPPAIISNGRILFEGKDTLKMNTKDLNTIRRKEISIIFQDPIAALNPVFKVGTILGDVIKCSSLEKGEELSKEDIKKKSMAVLKEVALPDPERLLNNYPCQLSGGMRQRVCIALALACAGKLLIADEPDTNLDVTIKDQVLRLIKNLVDEMNTSIILISHGLGAVKGLVDRVYTMYAGTIVETAQTYDLFSDPLHPYTRGLIKSVPKLTGGGIPEGIPGRLPNYINPPVGCRFAPRCERAKPICSKSSPTLVNLSNEHEVACFLYGE